MQTTKTLTVRVAQGIYEQVSREAEAARMGVAEYIRKAISDQLDTDHQAQRLEAIEARLNEKLSSIQQAVNSLGVEE